MDFERFHPSNYKLAVDPDLGYVESMATVTVELDDRLVAQINSGNVAADVSRIVALQLFRDGKVSLTKAAELAQTPFDDFRDFARFHGEQPPNFVDDVESVREARAISYLHSLNMPAPPWLKQAWQSAQLTDSISLDEINQEIAASRRERRDRRLSL